MASFNGLYYLISHYNVVSMINQLHYEHTHIISYFSLHLSMFSCFENHLMEICLQLSFLFCTSNPSDTSLLIPHLRGRVNIPQHHDLFWPENWMKKLLNQIIHNLSWQLGPLDHRGRLLIELVKVTENSLVIEISKIERT